MPPAATVSTILPSRTTTPRAASSARMPMGSLIQIAFVSAMSITTLQFGDHGQLALVLQDCYRKTDGVESFGVFMDLNTIAEVAHPQSRSELPVWTPGDAWLAGGTWLFSEPQVQLRRLIDLTDLGWPALTITEHGLSIAATCTVAQLDALACPPDWLPPPPLHPARPACP